MVDASRSTVADETVLLTSNIVKFLTKFSSGGGVKLLQGYMLRARQGRDDLSAFGGYVIPSAAGRFADQAVCSKDTKTIGNPRRDPTTFRRVVVRGWIKLPSQIAIAESCNREVAVAD